MMLWLIYGFLGLLDRCKFIWLLVFGLMIKWYYDIGIYVLYIIKMYYGLFVKLLKVYLIFIVDIRVNVIKIFK